MTRKHACLHTTETPSNQAYFASARALTKLDQARQQCGGAIARELLVLITPHSLCTMTELIQVTAQNPGGLVRTLQPGYDEDRMPVTALRNREYRGGAR